MRCGEVSVRVAAVGVLVGVAAVVAWAAAGAGGKEAAATANPLDGAWEAVQIANWGEAVEIFESHDADVAESEVRAEALFALGHIWQHRRPGEDMRKAVAYYRRVVDEFPTSKAAPWAELTLARIIDLPDNEPRTAEERNRLLADTRGRYRRIMEAYEGHLVAHEAALRLGVSYLAQAGDAEAERTGAEILIAYLGGHADNYLAANMHILVGDWHERNGRWREAVDSFAAAYDAGLPSMFHQAKTCFRIAQIAEYRLGDDARAVKWYKRLLDEAPRDNRHYLARLGAERCGARLAAAREEAAP
ncbi:MAG: tetratricopeptide repeat protein [Planctomycetes bacterium]|nr:tetratricopeptide repeat protein [Planctomycetota bacterium]